MTRKMIFEFLTNMRNTVLLFLLILGLSGCEFFALSFAPGKEPLADNSDLANQASKVFWETLHQGDYSNISKPMTLLKAAYLQNPYDAKIAVRIGFLRAWSLTERQRLKKSLHRLQTMQFWQESILKKRFDSIMRMLVTSDFTVP